MFSFRTKRNAQQGRGRRRIFLDYASTTPVDAAVLRAMEPYFAAGFANPAALYAEGVAAKAVVEECRLRVARLLGVKESEMYFTGSGTESDNMALLGIFEYARQQGMQKPHVIVSAIEHPAIIETAKEIERRGGAVTYLAPDGDGKISEAALAAALTENTVLVSLMYANNEIGTVAPLRAYSRVIQKFKASLGREREAYPHFHTDASQAPNYLPCNPHALGVDLMTLDGHKIYGPKGIGCLYKNTSVHAVPVLFGGGQERGLRSGTLNVPGIVGFAAALEKASRLRERESARLLELREFFIENIVEMIPTATINGADSNRLPNMVNVCIPGIDSEFEVINLDAHGVACAYATACKTLDDASRSYVVGAVSGDACAASSLRFSLGRDTQKKDITAALCVLEEMNYNERTV